MARSAPATALLPLLLLLHVTQGNPPARCVAHITVNEGCGFFGTTGSTGFLVGLAGLQSLQEL